MNKVIKVISDTIKAWWHLSCGTSDTTVQQALSCKQGYGGVYGRNLFCYFAELSGWKQAEFAEFPYGGIDQWDEIKGFIYWRKFDYSPSSQQTYDGRVLQCFSMREPELCVRREPLNN